MRIGVAGAGLVGRLLAWKLLRAGHQVDLFDRDNGSGEQSSGLIAAAMLAPYSEVVSAEHAVFSPGLMSLKDWHRWLEELQIDGGYKVHYQQRGSVVVAHQVDRADLQWFFDRLHALPEVQAKQCQWLSHNELHSLEPELTVFREGIYLPNEGCLDNRALFVSLKHAIHRLGGQWHSGQVISDVASGAITSSTGRQNFDLALDCRGFGGKPQLEGFRGVRGEVLWVSAPEVNLSRPVRLMHPRYQLYVAPKPDNIYVIGATEIESESLAPITVRSSLELLTALYSIHSGFSEGSILEARSNCRPAFMNNLPKIIRSPGLMRINGLYRHGYLLAPALINTVLALLEDKPPHDPVSIEDHSVTPSNSLKEITL